MSHIQGKMLDLVFVVGDPEQWHEENMKRNHAHYSFMKWLGPSTVSLVQRAPAGVYYNPLVTVDTQVHTHTLREGEREREREREREGERGGREGYIIILSLISNPSCCQCS